MVLCRVGAREGSDDAVVFYLKSKLERKWGKRKYVAAKGICLGLWSYEGADYSLRPQHDSTDIVRYDRTVLTISTDLYELKRLWVVANVL